MNAVEVDVEQILILKRLLIRRSEQSIGKGDQIPASGPEHKRRESSEIPVARADT